MTAPVTINGVAFTGAGKLAKVGFRLSAEGCGQARAAAHVNGTPRQYSSEKKGYGEFVVHISEEVAEQYARWDRTGATRTTPTGLL